MSAALAPDTDDLLSLPPSAKVLDSQGKVKTIVISTAGKVAVCCNLPSPPGGWYGPFGFFRLVSVAFFLGAIASLVLSLLAAAGEPRQVTGPPDGFAYFASLLSTFSCLVCAVAAYAHEGLASQVALLAKETHVFASKTEHLQSQVQKLSDVSDRMQKLQLSIGMDLERLQDLLRKLHEALVAGQLATIVRAFSDCDGWGQKDGRLTGAEVQDFFDNVGPLLKEAAPEFDYQALLFEAQVVGIDLCGVKFLINALAASSASNPGRSTAELSLLLFSLGPVKHFNETFRALKATLCPKHTEEEVRSMLEEVKVLASVQERARALGNLSSLVVAANDADAES